MEKWPSKITQVTNITGIGADTIKEALSFAIRWMIYYDSILLLVQGTHVPEYNGLEQNSHHSDLGPEWDSSTWCLCQASLFYLLDAEMGTKVCM